MLQLGVCGCCCGVPGCVHMAGSCACVDGADVCVVLVCIDRLPLPMDVTTSMNRAWQPF